MSPSENLRLVWEFYGPQAEPTAAHFAKHLREFLEKHALSTELSQVRVGAGMEVHLVLDRAVAEQVGRSLRPRRVEHEPWQGG